jgi:ADP-ribose diphosphatase
MKPLPQVLETQTLAESRLFKIESLRLRFANGAETEYERIIGSSTVGAVLIAAQDDQQRLLFIREYAAGVNRYDLVLPKGRMEPNESGRATAQRELREETGYAAAEFEHLSTVAVAPGYTNFETQIWFARSLSAAPLPGDEPEAAEVVRLSIDDAMAAMVSGELNEARSMLAVFLVQRSLNSMP